VPESEMKLMISVNNSVQLLLTAHVELTIAVQHERPYKALGPLVISLI
jgi:hypothetical protein